MPNKLADLKRCTYEYMKRITVELIIFIRNSIKYPEHNLVQKF